MGTKKKTKVPQLVLLVFGQSDKTSACILLLNRFGKTDNE